MTKAETGMTYDELKAAQGSDFYPDFFCGEPENEPSCVPKRDEAKNKVLEKASKYVDSPVSADDLIELVARALPQRADQLKSMA